MRRWQVLGGLRLSFGSFGLLFVSIAGAAEPADGVPDSASVVLRVKAPQASLGKLGDFVDAVQPGTGAVVKGNLATLGLAISNPTLAGVDVEKDWWAIAFAESRQRPAVVFVVPTTDVNEAKNALPPEYRFHSADKLAIYSESEDALNKVRDRLSGKGTALWSKIDASSKKLFDRSDLSVLVHVRQLAQAFESELQQAEPQLDALLNQISGAVPDVQRAQLVPMLEMYRVLGKSALQGVRDSHSLTLGVSFSKDAIRFEDRLQVGAGTATAKFFAAQPTSELPLMNRLPPNKLAYFGVKMDMGGMIDWSMNMTKVLTRGASNDRKAQLDAVAKEMHLLKWNEIAGYFNLEQHGGGAIRAASVVEVTPTNRLRELRRSMMKAVPEVQTPAFKQTTKLEPAVETINGIEVDRITIQQEFGPSLDPLGIQKRIRDVLFGEAGMQQLVMYQPNRSLQTFGGDKAEMQALLTSLDSTTTNDVARTAARKRFFDKANVVVLVDLARLAVSGLKLAAREKVIQIDASVFDGLQLQPSYIGGAIACEATAASAQLEIPVAQAQGIATIVSLVMQHYNRTP